MIGVERGTSLADVLVVDMAPDWGDGSAGIAALLRQLLAGAGARVIRAEDRSGETRSSPPYPHVHGEPPVEDVTEPELPRLVESADVVLMRLVGEPSSDEPTSVAAQRVSPRAIVVVIEDDDLGVLDQPRCGHELIVQAATGVVFEHIPGRAAFNGMRLGTYAAAMNAAVAVVAALIERMSSGVGQRLHVSMASGAVAAMTVVWPELAESVGSPQAAVPVGADFPLYRCADGEYVCVAGAPRSANSMELLRDILELDADVSEMRGDRGEGGDMRNFYVNYELLASGFRKFSSVEIFHRLRDADFSAEIVRPPSAFWDSPDVEQRGLIETCSCGVKHVGLPIVGV